MALASLAVLLIAAGYAALCTISPFGPCRKCRGTGIRQVRKTVKDCRRCRGQRLRLRVGRRLLNTGRTLHAAGTRPHRPTIRP
ncbi:UNVERIFIED_CONTAM: ribosomal protein L40E [Streptomyces graminofaciens]